MGLVCLPLVADDNFCSRLAAGGAIKSRTIEFAGRGQAWCNGRTDDVGVAFLLNDETLNLGTRQDCDLHGVLARRIPGSFPARYTYQVRSSVTTGLRPIEIEVSSGIEKGEAGVVTFIDGKQRNEFQVAAAPRMQTLRLQATGEGWAKVGNKTGFVATIDLSEGKLEMVTSPYTNYSETEAVRVPDSNPPRYVYSVYGIGWRQVFIEVSPEVFDGQPGTITFIDGSHRNVLQVTE